MNSQANPSSFTAPYPHSASFIHRYLETLMSMTHQYPRTMESLVYLMGGISLVLTPSVWALPALGLNVPAPAAIAMSSIGAVGTVVSAANGVIQHHLFGFPMGKAAPYHDETYALPDEKTAHGEIRVDQEHMPILRVQADNHYNAGRVEGYLLGESMQVNLNKMNKLYSVVRPFIGAPRKDADLNKYLIDVLKTIPNDYQEEMRGKVAGYNQWLTEKSPAIKPLTFERYVLMHLLPDFMNYNPFSRYTPVAAPAFGCTTTLLRLANYTFVIRVLDWPSYGLAGQYFLQIERDIKGKRRTIDIANPLLTGALTVLNEEGLLIEMNVSKGDKVLQPQGMPALFFNRYCAENAGSVAGIDKIIETQKPLGPYHLTASDGNHAQSFHFYQDANVRGAHVVETLGEDKNTPQFFVVANNGLKHKNNKPVVDDHCDSHACKQNIQAFIKQESIQQLFSGYMAKQDERVTLGAEDILALKQICLQIARLALVCNFESVLCGIYVYFQGRLLEASTLTDNLYAQKKDLSESKKLYSPYKKAGTLFAVVDAKQESTATESNMQSPLLGNTASRKVG